ncbi:putative NAD/NADP octopine/nopaline dehydrogenase [Xylariaceae sp. FL0594]|nr:putative NAD/NADP octopine/nopaline dehydrogenase [Xylariaceae sp. FL0594]
MITSVSIIGIGGCGCALSADLERRGIKTLLYAHPEHARNARALLRQGHLDAVGEDEEVAGRFHPAVSTDMGEALRFARVVVLAVPAYAQEDVLAELERHDVGGHVVVAASGNFFALVACRRIRPRYLLETSASPYASRIVDVDVEEGSGRRFYVHVLGVKKSMPIASLPTDIDEDTRADIATVFPRELHWCSNVIEAAFYNFNGVLHPVTTIMNAGWIENTEGDFYFYKEGMTPAVSRMMHEIDLERLSIAQSYISPSSSSRLPSCLEQMNTYYNLSCTSLHDFARRSSHHSTMKVCPRSTRHRYITEDLPYVLVPWYELGVKAGKEKELPFIRSLILWCGAVNGTDYRATGRNIRALGFADCTREEIVHLVCATTSDTLAAELERYKEEEEGGNGEEGVDGMMSTSDSSFGAPTFDFALFGPKL